MPTDDAPGRSVHLCVAHRGATPEDWAPIVTRRGQSSDWQPSLQAVVDRLDNFEHGYNQIAKPFQWTFTRRDLSDLIARVSNHEPRLRLAA